MRKTLTIISMLAVIYVGQPQIKLNPFSMSFETFYLMIPMFIVFGIWIFHKEDFYSKGYLDGYKEASKDAVEEIKRIINKNK